jgi:hypothetical protein
MSLVRYKAKNHPQQLGLWGVDNTVDDRALPAEDFAKLHARFNFTIDAAAAEHNTKLPRFYSLQNSGLIASWAGERVYCNPPFSLIEPWVKKAWAEPDALVVMILPANRTEQGWWQRHIEPKRDRYDRLKVEFLPGRQRFINSGKTAVGPNERPPFGICLCIWR